MRKILLLGLLLILCIGASAEAAEKPRLSVRAFENKTDGSVPAEAITDMMITELYETQLFTLLEREKLDYVAEEIRLGQSGLVDPATAPPVGQIQGAQYTMTGAVTRYYYNASGGVMVLPGGGGALASNTGYVVIDIRLISNVTGEVVYAAACEGASNQTLGGLITKYGGFASGRIGGVLAAATRNAVMKHVEGIRGLPF